MLCPIKQSIPEWLTKVQHLQDAVGIAGVAKVLQSKVVFALWYILEGLLELTGAPAHSRSSSVPAEYPGVEHLYPGSAFCLCAKVPQ